MILRRLRYFAAVAEASGISRAASRLFIAQPALTRQIHDLERLVGIPLFERVHRGVQLTAAGVRLHSDVEWVFQRLDDTVRRIHLAHAGTLATFRLGLSRGALDSRRVGRLLVAFRDQYPFVDLRVREVGVSMQATALKANELDAAIGLGEETEPALLSLALFDEHVDSAMFAESHRLAGCEMIEPRDLVDEPCRLDSISLPRFPSLSDALERLGFSCEVLEGIDTVLGYVASGSGWTTALSSAHADHPAGMVVRRLRGMDVPIPMVLRWPRSEERAVVRNFALVASWACASVSNDLPAPPPDDVDSGEADTGEVMSRARTIARAQLRAFVTSLNEGSSNAAAEQLGLTHSAVSRQIANLERLIGVPLVARVGGRLMPTAAGAILRDEAPEILELVDTALDRARRSAGGVAGHCAIGSISRELTDGLLIEVLKVLTERYPEITITVVEGSLQAALLSGDVDLAIVSLYPGAMEDPLLASMPLHDDPLSCALISASHPLAQRDKLEPSDLAKDPLLFVAREFAPDAYDLIVHAMRQVGLNPSLGAEYNGARAIWRAVASGGGWAIAPRSLCASPPPGTAARSIEGLSIPWGIGLQWRRDEMNPVVNRVADVIRALAKTSADG